jgi:hypothetical protein
LEIVFQNNDTTVQTYHIDGYAFWVVGWVKLLFLISLCWHIFKSPGYWIIVILPTEWTMASGLRIAVGLTTSGMVFLVARLR